MMIACTSCWTTFAISTQARWLRFRTIGSHPRDLFADCRFKCTRIIQCYKWKRGLGLENRKCARDFYGRNRTKHWNTYLMHREQGRVFWISRTIFACSFWNLVGFRFQYFSINWTRTSWPGMKYLGLLQEKLSRLPCDNNMKTRTLVRAKHTKPKPPLP